MTAKAAILYCKMLYYVYHSEPCGCDDPVILHERMRTLSTELMLLFDDTDTGGNTTLACPRRFARKTFEERKFMLHPCELRMHMARGVRMGGIVTRYCKKRLELCESMSRT